jgi:ATP-dependent protease ClpP protease subunit
LIVPNKYYRPNPTRAIHVTGVINRELLSRLTPQILKLQHLSRDPITVYIDSPGGNVGNMEAILHLLRLADQDASPACHLITVVTTSAASAAADLLSSGDYALAFPNSSVLYHGLRRQEDGALTMERTSMLANVLRRSNDIYAMQLARKIEDRFSFRFVSCMSEFNDVRAQHPGTNMSDVDCFIEVLEGKLSFQAKEVWQKVRNRHGRYEDLFSNVFRNSRRKPGPVASFARLEGDVIKGLVDFEVKRNKRDPNWQFRGAGLSQLADDFFLFNEYLSSYNDERLMNWCTSFGKYILPADDIAEIDAISDADEQNKKILEKVRPLLQPLWSFFVALCHALQEGENELTAHDAYWLGLIDEVVGDSNIMSVRSMAEYRPDPPVKKDGDEEEEGVPQKADGAEARPSQN